MDNYKVQPIHPITFTGNPLTHFVNPIAAEHVGKAQISKLPTKLACEIEKRAYSAGLSTSDWLAKQLGISLLVSKLRKPASTLIDNVRVKTHLDGEQYFETALKFLKSAKKSIQIEMFEFQNYSIDGKYWSNKFTKGSKGAYYQQQLLTELIKKKEANPNINIQIILDAHKWGINSEGDKVKHYANQDMIKYLLSKGIDVVPYPRPAQQGAVLQHVKLFIVDAKKALIGGMNWGTHSALNHDACISLEKTNNKPSVVDNLVDKFFNTDWAFSWQRLGETKLVSGPLSEAEQVNYNGLNKLIKSENVDYFKLLSEFYNTEPAKTRYSTGNLNLLKVSPTNNSSIKILCTRPQELQLVSKTGLETTNQFILDKLKTCKKLYGELFVLTDKEVLQAIIKQVKAGKLDARFIVDESIIREFPYCKKAYDTLVSNGINVKVYKADSSINQRMHSKWAVFDDKDILIGSTNWSSQGLTQNLGKGIRPDYLLTNKEITTIINTQLEKTREQEGLLGFSKLKWTQKAYKDLISRIKTIKTWLVKKESTNKEAMRELLGSYMLVQRQHLSRPKFKRGNNEISIVFSSENLAKKIFQKQFETDWKLSNNSFNSLKETLVPIRKLDVKA